MASLADVFESRARWAVDPCDCRFGMASLPSDSVDAIVCDPPYSLGFMSKTWDEGGRCPISTDFGMWLAGFADGEGNFDIHKQKRPSGDYYYCRFEISLREDDGGVLHMLQQRLGGKVYAGKAPETGGGKPKFRWELVSRAECSRLVDVFDRYPLQSKKRRDFIIWREALAESMRTPGINRPEAMEPFWLALRACREHVGPVTDVAHFRRAASEFNNVALDRATWEEALRVAKPGAHLLAFGGTRTYHALTMAIEDAGWEIRDCLCWLYGSGFPKSLNVSKQIDSMLGAERAIVGPSRFANRGRRTDNGVYQQSTPSCAEVVSLPASAAAATADGYGTALKPAFEPCVLARKPLDGTVAANFMQHGTGALNVDGCRVEMSPEDFAELQSGVEAIRARGGSMGNSWKNSSDLSGANPANQLGRWPANVVMDEEAAALLDAQAGDHPGMSGGGVHRADYEGGMFGKIDCAANARNDSGGPSRFFYTAKASRSERDAGLDDFEARTAGAATDRTDGTDGLESPRAGAGRTGGARNIHPTVKPVDLMRWLVRLVGRPGALILDPFTGSGSTGVAAMLEGMRFVGFELEPLHVDFARARIAHVIGGTWEREVKPERPVVKVQPSLFDAIGGGK